MDGEATQRLRTKNLEALRACTLCIICAKSNEAATVKDQLGTKSTITGDLVDQIDPGHQFYLGLLQTETGHLSYYVTSCTRQGIQSFAAQSAALFSILKPTYALHVGVCAAISGQNIELKDVIFGERALNYEEGKWLIIDKKPSFAADSLIHTTKSDIMTGFLVENGRPSWKHGDFISGCAVRMDSKYIFDRVRATLREVKALDMEASAFLQVCRYVQVSGSDKVQALGIIKGVSDMGDEYKGVGSDIYYNVALRNAAKAANEFAQWRFKEECLTFNDIKKQPGAIVVPGYFNHFVNEVVEKAFEADLNITVGKNDVKMQGFRIVMPRNNNVATYKKLSTITQPCAFDLQEISLKGSKGNRATSVWTKGPYFVDFPTALTSLENYVDATDQVQHFKTTLVSKLEESYCTGFTQVITWDDFLHLCKEVNGATAGGEQTTI